MVIKKLILALILSFVSGNCHSQKWFFLLKPLIGTPLVSFQRFDKIVYDPVINYSNGNKPSSISISDNIRIHFQYNIEIFADFYKINPKWNVGAGMGVYNGNRTFLKLIANQQNSVLKTNDEIILGNAVNSTTSSVGPVDFNGYLLASRKLKFDINSKKQVEQCISIGMGFTKNKKNDLSYILGSSGLFVYETHKSHNYFPFLMLRYEFEFLSKTNKNLFNLSMTYQQGIYKVASFTNYDIYDVGTYDYQRAEYRGSSVGLSISKSFNLTKSKR